MSSYTFEASGSHLTSQKVGQPARRAEDRMATLWPIFFAYKFHTSNSLKMGTPGTFQVVQWYRILLPMQGMRVQSLVRELRFYIPQGN